MMRSTAFGSWGGLAVSFACWRRPPWPTRFGAFALLTVACSHQTEEDERAAEVGGSTDSTRTTDTKASPAGGRPNAAGGASAIGGIGNASNPAAGGSSSSSSGGTSSQEAAEKGLCTVSMSCSQAIVDKPSVPCTFEVRDSTGVAVFSDHANVSLRGRSSLKFPKKNYALELHTADGLENPVNLLGMGKESDWILDGAWADRSFMRNRLTFSQFRDMGSARWAPRSRYCEVTLNGSYDGIYALGEKIKRDDDRVVLPDDDGTGSTFLIKQTDDGTLRLSIGAGSKWEVLYPTAKNITPTQSQAVQVWLDQLGTALNSSNPADLLVLFDAAAVTDWILIEEFAKNIDAYNLSLHFARAAGGPAWIIPWDFDLGYGQPTLRNATNEAPEGWVYNRTTLISKFSANSSLRQGLGPRWRELRNSVFSDAAVFARIDGYAAVLTPAAVDRNFALWPIANVDFTQFYAPYSFYDVTSYDEEMSHFRGWIADRLQWLDANIDSYPSK